MEGRFDRGSPQGAGRQVLTRDKQGGSEVGWPSWTSVLGEGITWCAIRFDQGGERARSQAGPAELALRGRPLDPQPEHSWEETQ